MAGTMLLCAQGCSGKKNSTQTKVVQQQDGATPAAPGAPGLIKNKHKKTRDLPE
jgi:hypothetical protein